MLARYVIEKIPKKNNNLDAFIQKRDILKKKGLENYT